MSTALNLFYLADGVEFLSDSEQEIDEYQQEWWAFVTILYKRIIKGDFPSAPIKFELPIIRVGRYKMEKSLTDPLPKYILIANLRKFNQRDCVILISFLAQFTFGSSTSTFVLTV